MKHFRPTKNWEEGQGYFKRKLLGDELFPLSIDMLQENRFKKGESVPAHYHKVQTEIFYVLAPGKITISDETIEVNKSDIVVCEPGEVHSIPTVKEEFGFLVLKVDYHSDDTVWL
jgi:quercetin dioxygenase-like cupin family protein